MIRSREGLRVLGPTDLPAALEVLAEDPVVNVFVEYRSRLTHLDSRWLGGQMWGWVEEGRLASLCHVGANLVPVQAGGAALAAYVEQALRQRRSSATIVGPQESVRGLWEGLSAEWSPPREERWDQPHMVARDAPAVAPDPLVRRTEPSEIETIYPSCVAMYTEEVGVSPEADGGRDLYHARVTQLVNRGWSFSRIEQGRVLFKAEVACATPSACQVQGVYVDPAMRGQGLAASGMAAVVAHCLREVAPVVSLYVNGHNTPARRAYERAGFEQTATFSTLMF